ncbi:hypothetical protein V1512DRAFT_257592 [Lipomyces arxii]|uniref:uncharacterized protein n=1 Tax=Lipomyces arxii TaxID=56418 RepID=UPI0034CF8E54
METSNGNLLRQLAAIGREHANPKNLYQVIGLIVKVGEPRRTKAGDVITEIVMRDNSCTAEEHCLVLRVRKAVSNLSDGDFVLFTRVKIISTQDGQIQCMTTPQSAYIAWDFNDKRSLKKSINLVLEQDRAENMIRRFNRLRTDMLDTGTLRSKLMLLKDVEAGMIADMLVEVHALRVRNGSPLLHVTDYSIKKSDTNTGRDYFLFNVLMDKADASQIQVGQIVRFSNLMIQLDTGSLVAVAVYNRNFTILQASDPAVSELRLREANLQEAKQDPAELDVQVQATQPATQPTSQPAVPVKQAITVCDLQAKPASIAEILRYSKTGDRYRIRGVIEDCILRKTTDSEHKWDAIYIEELDSYAFTLTIRDNTDVMPVAVCGDSASQFVGYVPTNNRAVISAVQAKVKGSLLCNAELSVQTIDLDKESLCFVLYGTSLLTQAI